MNQIQEKTVADFVTENIKSAHIFKKYGIDFCCGGKVSLAEACQKKSVNLEQITQDLAHLEADNGRQTQYHQWGLDFLSDHIVNIHHRYVKDSLPILKSYSAKVTQVHGHHFEELAEIQALLNTVSNELLSHMNKEEMILFPFIKSMVKANKMSEKKVEHPPFGTVNRPIAMMLEEHESAGEIFEEIKELTNQFQPPAEACNTFRALYAGLEEFQDDLHLHIHLENNILFPKAIALENELTAVA